MPPLKAFAAALVLNVIAVIAMERIRQLWKGVPPTFAAEPALWYAALAITIVATQFFLIAASLSNAFPMSVAIAINIALVLTAANLNGCRATGRWPTPAELAALAALITTTFLFQVATAAAERAHQERQPATNHSNA
jgi:hypothetical protein